MAVLLYTLLGFFAAPAIIENTIVSTFRDDLGREARVGKVEVNPFVLSVKVQGFEVNDTDNVKLADFDEFFINFQLSSLFHWAWTFDEVRLTGPYLFFERFASGVSRLDRLLADYEKSLPAEELAEGNGEQEGGPMRVLIHNLSLVDGHVDARDGVPATPVETRLAPIKISIQELNTLPDRHGRQSVSIQLPGGASLQWSGSLTLAPLDSQGELSLSGLHLDPLIAYLQAALPLETFSASLSSRFRYSLHLGPEDGLKVAVDDLEIELDDLLVSGLTPVTEFAVIPKISLTGGQLRYPQQSLRFGSLAVENPQITAWLKPDGSLSMMDLISGDDAGQGVPDQGAPASAWRLGIDDFRVSSGEIALSDRSIQPVAEVDVTDLQIRITEVSNRDDAMMPLEVAGRFAAGGNYSFDGSVGILPEFALSGNATMRGIPLSLGQSYIQQFAHIVVNSGAIDSDIQVNMPTGGELTLAGSVQIPKLEIDDTLENRPLLGWVQLDIDRFDLDSGGLHLSQMVFDQLFGRLVIREDLTTNVSALTIGPVVAGDDEAGEGQGAFSIVVGGIQVEDGSMDFADFSLPLPFETHIVNLDGTISTIATNSQEPARIRLEGQVDDYGLARIEGSMDVLDPIRHTDVELEFRNLLMPRLSPYTIQFAGREIDAGKLDMGLVYGIEEGRLHGSNNVVLSDLVLGARVDHPDASSLPLGLAVGLLKDADGVIRIDLPVEGDINDPEFQIGGVIWKAVTGLIGKIVSAPFRFLGNLIGVESEDLGEFEFLAGRSDLTPPELEKIGQLQQALQQRPELVVEIGGVTDRTIDVPALKFFRLRQTVYGRIEQDEGDADDEAMMLDVEIRAVMEELFSERFPDISLESFRLEHMTAPADDPKARPVLDELAYAADLLDSLLESEVITDADLAALANARAEVIRAAFLADGTFDSNRVIISGPQEAKSEDGEWIRLELAVASG